MRNISLVYVHIGDNLPEYLFDSLYQTLLVNLYKTKIYIIVSDNLVETLERGIRCFNLNDYTKRDFNFENVFARQVDAHGKKFDVLVAITTSGSSLNCILAAKAAKAKGMKVVTLTRAGGEISQFADQSIEVPSSNTQHIQECHIISYHIMSEIIESSLFGEDLK